MCCEGYVGTCASAMISCLWCLNFDSQLWLLHYILTHQKSCSYINQKSCSEACKKCQTWGWDVFGCKSQRKNYLRVFFSQIFLNFAINLYRQIHWTHTMWSSTAWLQRKSAQMLNDHYCKCILCNPAGDNTWTWFYMQLKINTCWPDPTNRTYRSTHLMSSQDIFCSGNHVGHHPWTVLTYRFVRSSETKLQTCHIRALVVTSWWTTQAGTKPFHSFFLWQTTSMQGSQEI